MDDKNTPISRVTHESAEPTSTSAVGKDQPVSIAPKATVRDSSTSSLPATKKLQTKRAASAANSPNPSRESSPVRPTLKSTTAARSATGPNRSRKNSHQDVSPSRSTSTSTNPPSAAATQRALSAASIPSLHPTTSEPTIRAPVPQKPSAVPEIRETPRWPVSPRLRSPPPINRPSPFSPRKSDQEVPAINVQKILPSTEQQEGKQATTDSEAEDLLAPGMRTPARGASGASSTLETVQEISQPNTPRELSLDGMLEKENGMARVVAEPDNFEDNASNASNKTIKARPSVTANESGSESGGKGEIKMRSTSAAPQAGLRSNAPSTKSLSTVASRSKAGGEGSTQNMTVETETVSSIPQVALGGTAGGGNNGSIRAKPSSETIRPRKEKKKTARKAPSVTSGTASSKADIFEAKVASAVDEANSSDSEETFVYESNPPDVSDRPRRFHSRTPSATSMASQVEQRNGVRSILDGHHSVAMKKSMKFANSYNSGGPESTTGEDDGKGTARSAVGTGRGTTHHHHMGGRWSRNSGNGHPSLFDNESPFPNASKSKVAGNGPRQSSRPESPRVANMRMLPNGKLRSPILSGYDLDDGADDERTPLISSSVRSSRSQRRRPMGSSIRQLEHQASRENRSCMSRVAGCLVLMLMIVLVVAGAVGFILATTQALTDVKVVALKDVLASEQDIIFDMKVQARNPNLVVVTIDQADLVVFAKSKYAGTDSEWWRRPQNMLRRALRIRDDDPDDPPLGDDPTTNPNLEIGHVYNFDSPLTFEGSPFHGELAYSLGQIRIKHPGNHTEPAGSERWGRVLQHPFDLIVRGTLKYSLPLSPRVRSISVDGRITVQPNAADQDPDDIAHIS